MSRLNSATHLWPEEDLDRLRLMTVIVAEREEWYALGLPCPVTWEGRGGAEGRESDSHLLSCTARGSSHMRLWLEWERADVAPVGKVP